MSFPALLRVASVALPVALGCGGVAAAQQIVNVPPGFTLVLVPSPGAAPQIIDAREAASPPVALMPIERMFAEQRAIMARMTADMNSLFAPTANPLTRIDALIQRMGMPELATSPASAGSYCAESVSVSYAGPGTAPLVKVSHSGNGCGPNPASGSAAVAAPSAPPHQKLIEIDAPARIVTAHASHRT